MKSVRLLAVFVAALALVIVPTDAAGVAAAPGGCGTAIGFEGPITGPVAALGHEQLAFAQLAVSADNAANGTNISLVEGDTKLTPGKATVVTRQFTSDSNIVAVVGPAGSQEVAAVGPLMARAGMPFITGSATRSMLTDRANATFFRVVSSDSVQGPGDARYIIHKLHPRAVMVIDDKEPYSTGLARSMISLLRKAGIRVDHESVSQKVTDFSSLVAKVSRRTSVVILPWQFAANAEQFGKTLAKQHKKAVIFGTDGLQSSAFTIPGSYVSTFGPDITAIPADAAVAAAAKAKYPNYGIFGPPVYAATDVVAGAIAAVCRAGQQPTRNNILAQIRFTNEPKSILGQPIRFASNGELEGAHWFLFRIDRKHHYRMLVTQTGSPVVPDRDPARPLGGAGATFR
ncbi:MAG: branched-chain amino acid ABC transporter substrate-binding protein [Solirubrobacteraceae bacterium]